MMMELDILLKSVSVVRVEGDTARNITGINMDSRLVQPGDLFVAVKGTQADGHAYIGKAIEKGAVAVVCEAWPEVQAEGVTYVQVKDSESAVGRLATVFYGDPTPNCNLSE